MLGVGFRACPVAPNTVDPLGQELLTIAGTVMPAV